MCAWSYSQPVSTSCSPVETSDLKMMDHNCVQLGIVATATSGPVLFWSSPVELMVFFQSIGLDLKTLTSTYSRVQATYTTGYLYLGGALKHPHTCISFTVPKTKALQLGLLLIIIFLSCSSSPLCALSIIVDIRLHVTIPGHTTESCVQRHYIC